MPHGARLYDWKYNVDGGNYMAMTLLGPDIGKMMRDMPGQTFTLRTALLLG